MNLIMTDYCMPEMTGYDLLKIVKASSAFKEIPVIVMSSENDSNRIERYIQFTTYGPSSCSSAVSQSDRILHLNFTSRD